MCLKMPGGRLGIRVIFARKIMGAKIMGADCPRTAVGFKSRRVASNGASGRFKLRPFWAGAKQTNFEHRAVFQFITTRTSCGRADRPAKKRGSYR